ncbi:MAG: PA domain-containing protein, partial [Vicinamibacteria bacterium]
MRFTTASRRSVGFFVALAALDAALASGEKAGPPPAFERKTLEEHIRYLASDELAGRGNGTSGLDDAALYIRKTFEVIGLEPAGEGGTYLQTFRVTTGQELGRHTGALLRTPDGVRTLEYGKDFEPLSLSVSGEVEAPVTFAGYGITAPEYQYDDYASVDVRGRIVLLLRYAPDVFGEHGWHATFARKAQNAASHGALAVLVVNGPRHHRDDKIVPFRVDVGAAETASIPTVHLKRAHAEALLRASGRSLLELQTGIDESLAPRSFAVDGVEMALTVDVRRATVSVANILGFLPPSGAGTREHIVIGAHYDHLGLGEKGSRDRRARGLVHNGADDNASGV